MFTTEVVAFPGTVHIDEQKDFTPVIEKALELGGYKEDQTFTGINGGTQVTTGFGHSAILSHADTVIEAVKSGIRFLPLLFNVNKRRMRYYCTENIGVCGKKADTAQLQDELTGALIGLARAVMTRFQKDLA